MEADAAAFRRKFRTMASDPHAFYRGIRLPVLRRRDRRATNPYADEPERSHLDPRRPARGELRHLPQRRRPAGLRRERLRRGLPRPLHLGPAAVRGVAGAGRAGRRRSPRRTSAVCSRATSRPTSPRSTTTASTTTTTTSRCTSTTPTARCTRRWWPPGSRRRAELLDAVTVARRRRPDVPRGRRPCAGSAGESASEVVAAYEDYLDDHPGAASGSNRDLFYDLRDVVGKTGLRHRQRPACRRTTC